MNILDITIELAKQLIANQFPQFATLTIVPVRQQGYDNRTFRLGNDMLIRMPTAAPYALKVPKEQELLPLIKPHLNVTIPEPVAMGYPSPDYPFHFSIYKWVEGRSANHIVLDGDTLLSISLQLAEFLNTLQNIENIEGPAPGQHNWWRGSHISVYDEGARKQINQLTDIIDSAKAHALWEQACKTRWHKSPVWLHGDFASGNIIIKDKKLAGVIDFGGLAVGDPACDLVIAWTLLHGKSRELFINNLALDNDTWLRAKAWCLWKATYELCQLQDLSSCAATTQKRIINEII